MISFPDVVTLAPAVDLLCSVLCVCQLFLLPLLTFSAPASECACDFYLQVAPNEDVPVPGLNKERKSARLVAHFLSSYRAATNTLYRSQ